MIVRTEDPEDFKKIFKFIPKIKTSSYTEKEFKVWWIRHYDEKIFRVWIDVESEEDMNEIHGFLIAHRFKRMNDEEIFILLTYSDPNRKESFPEMLKRAESWARTMGIRKICACVNKGVNALEKKYGFRKGFTQVSKTVEY